jgi:hypothetical protein
MKRTPDGHKLANQPPTEKGQLAYAASHAYVRAPSFRALLVFAGVYCMHILSSLQLVPLPRICKRYPREHYTAIIIRMVVG